MIPMNHMFTGCDTNTRIPAVPVTFPSAALALPHIVSLAATGRQVAVAVEENMVGDDLVVVKPKVSAPCIDWNDA